jgi:hypothetical protein
MLDDFVRDGLDVAGGGTGRDDEVVGDARLAAYVDFDDILRLEFLDGIAHVLEEDFGRRRRVGKAGLDDLRGSGQGVLARWSGRDYTRPSTAGGVNASAAYSRWWSI